MVSEESQRRALEAARRGEEAEIAHRVEAAEQQLSTMSGVQASLESQLSASLRVQAELRQHITAERGGRSELEVAGERELSAWSEHNEKVCVELRSRLETERAEVDRWRETSAEEVGRLEQENSENIREESRLVEQLESVREWQTQVRRRLRTEVLSSNREVEVLKERVREADEEHRRSEDALRRNNCAQGACGDEREELEEELQERFGQANSAGGEIQDLEMASNDLQEQLREMQRRVERYTTDQEAERLRQEHESLKREVQREEQRHRSLRAEIEAERKSWGFLCMRRKQVPNSPPDSPREELPATSVGTMGQPPLPPPTRPPPKGSPSFPAGSCVAAVDTAPMHEGERMESTVVQQLQRGQTCTVLEVGSGRRLRVRKIDTGETGWITSMTRKGQELVVLMPEERSGGSTANRDEV